LVWRLAGVVGPRSSRGGLRYHHGLLGGTAYGMRMRPFGCWCLPAACLARRPAASRRT
jgi:hypothetical protein